MLFGPGIGAATLDPSTYAAELEAWRAGRLERLTAPDGWLSLVGLEWLQEGTNRIGSAPGSDVVLPSGPAELGVIELKDGIATLRLAEGVDARIGESEARSARLVDDAGGHPTVVRYGSASFHLIERNGLHGLRIKDSEAPARRQFAGIEHFPTDPAWRIEARWVPFDPPQSLELPNVLGKVDVLPVPGKAVFEYGGRSFELLPVLEEPGATELFFVFGDRTNGRESYGAGRFLYSAMPEGGTVVLDFGRAYNPPCVFTAFATCPLAPPENRLDLPVRAGEKKYVRPGS